MLPRKVPAEHPIAKLAKAPGIVAQAKGQQMNQPNGGDNQKPVMARVLSSFRSRSIFDSTRSWNQSAANQRARRTVITALRG